MWRLATCLVSFLVVHVAANGEATGVVTVTPTVSDVTVAKDIPHTLVFTSSVPETVYLIVYSDSDSDPSSTTYTSLFAGMVDLSTVDTSVDVTLTSSGVSYLYYFTGSDGPANKEPLILIATYHVADIESVTGPTGAVKSSEITAQVTFANGVTAGEVAAGDTSYNLAVWVVKDSAGAVTPKLQLEYDMTTASFKVAPDAAALLPGTYWVVAKLLAGAASANPNLMGAVASATFMVKCDISSVTHQVIGAPDVENLDNLAIGTILVKATISASATLMMGSTLNSADIFHVRAFLDTGAGSVELTSHRTINTGDNSVTFSASAASIHDFGDYSFYATCGNSDETDGDTIYDEFVVDLKFESPSAPYQFVVLTSAAGITPITPTVQAKTGTGSFLPLTHCAAVPDVPTKFQCRALAGGTWTIAISNEDDMTSLPVYRTLMLNDPMQLVGTTPVTQYTSASWTVVIKIPLPALTWNPRLFAQETALSGTTTQELACTLDPATHTDSASFDYFLCTNGAVAQVGRYQLYGHSTGVANGDQLSTNNVDVLGTAFRFADQFAIGKHVGLAAGEQLKTYIKLEVLHGDSVITPASFLAPDVELSLGSTTISLHYDSVAGNLLLFRVGSPTYTTLTTGGQYSLHGKWTIDAARTSGATVHVTGSTYSFLAAPVSPVMAGDTISVWIQTLDAAADAQTTGQPVAPFKAPSTDFEYPLFHAVAVSSTGATLRFQLEHIASQQPNPEGYYLFKGVAGAAAVLEILTDVDGSASYLNTTDQTVSESEKTSAYHVTAQGQLVLNYLSPLVVHSTVQFEIQVTGLGGTVVPFTGSFIVQAVGKQGFHLPNNNVFEGSHQIQATAADAQLSLINPSLKTRNVKLTGAGEYLITVKGDGADGARFNMATEDVTLVRAWTIAFTETNASIPYDARFLVADSIRVLATITHASSLTLATYPTVVGHVVLTLVPTGTGQSSKMGCETKVQGSSNTYELKNCVWQPTGQGLTAYPGKGFYRFTLQSDDTETVVGAMGATVDEGYGVSLAQTWSLEFQVVLGTVVNTAEDRPTPFYVFEDIPLSYVIRDSSDLTKQVIFNHKLDVNVWTRAGAGAGAVKKSSVIRGYASSTSSPLAPVSMLYGESNPEKQIIQIVEYQYNYTVKAGALDNESWKACLTPSERDVDVVEAKCPSADFATVPIYRPPSPTVQTLRGPTVLVPTISGASTTGNDPHYAIPLPTAAPQCTVESVAVTGTTGLALALIPTPSNAADHWVVAPTTTGAKKWLMGVNKVNCTMASSAIQLPVCNSQFFIQPTCSKPSCTTALTDAYPSTVDPIPSVVLDYTVSPLQSTVSKFAYNSSMTSPKIVVGYPTTSASGLKVYSCESFFNLVSAVATWAYRAEPAPTVASARTAAPADGHGHGHAADSTDSLASNAVNKPTTSVFSSQKPFASAFGQVHMVGGGGGKGRPAIELDTIVAKTPLVAADLTRDVPCPGDISQINFAYNDGRDRNARFELKRVSSRPQALIADMNKVNWSDVQNKKAVPEPVEPTMVGLYALNNNVSPPHPYISAYALVGIKSIVMDGVTYTVSQTEQLKPLTKSENEDCFGTREHQFTAYAQVYGSLQLMVTVYVQENSYYV